MTVVNGTWRLIATAMRCSNVLALLCLVSLMGVGCSLGQGLFARWRAWYHQKLKPCLRSCPYQSEFVCGFDHGRQRYAVAPSSCALARRNACFDEDYQEVPIENCLVLLKFHHEDNNLAITPPTNHTHVR